MSPLAAAADVPLVAVRDLTGGRDPQGYPFDLVQGRTFVSPDWSGLQDPKVRALFAKADSARAAEAIRSASAATRSSTPAVKPPSAREHVELRTKTAPKITVTLSRRVWEKLRDQASEAEDLRETGGFLFSDSVRGWRTDVRVGYSTRMITNRSRDSSALDVEALVREKAMLKRDESRASEIGCWHTHPFHADTRFERSDGIPSEADVQTLLSSLDYLGSAFYVGLILTPENRSGWGWKPERVAAWVVRRDGHARIPICEPATFVVTR